MTRHDLVNALKAYIPHADPVEHVHINRTLDLLAAKPDCFYRTCFEPGHITGSALLVSGDNTRVLMNHHAKLDKWMCFGGHADGDENIAMVARRETVEESGIGHIALASSGIVDVDVHPIPANIKKGEPAHEHFDIRYIYRTTGSETFTMSDESNALRWCDFDEAMALSGDDSMRRLLQKWRSGMRAAA